MKVIYYNENLTNIFMLQNVIFNKILINRKIVSIGMILNSLRKFFDLDFMILIRQTKNLIIPWKYIAGTAKIEPISRLQILDDIYFVKASSISSYYLLQEKYFCPFISVSVIVGGINYIYDRVPKRRYENKYLFNKFVNINK